MSTTRRRRPAEDEPLLFDLPLDAPATVDRRRRPAPVQEDLFAAAPDAGEDDDDLATDREPREQQTLLPVMEIDPAPEAASGPVVAGVVQRLLAGFADTLLHVGVLGGAYLGVVALDVEPRINDWPAFGLLLLAFSFLSSVVSLAFWGQTAGMAWRGLQSRDRLQRPLTFRQAALRWAGGLLTFGSAGLPLLFALGGSSLSDWMSRSVTYSMGGVARPS